MTKLEAIIKLANCQDENKTIDIVVNGIKETIYAWYVDVNLDLLNEKEIIEIYEK